MRWRLTERRRQTHAINTNQPIHLLESHLEFVSCLMWIFTLVGGLSWYSALASGRCMVYRSVEVGYSGWNQTLPVWKCLVFMLLTFSKRDQPTDQPTNRQTRPTIRQIQAERNRECNFFLKYYYTYTLCKLSCCFWEYNESSIWRNFAVNYLRGNTHTI